MENQENITTYKERKSAYVKKYQQETYVNVSFKLRKNGDEDILDILNGVPNKSEYIKGLIRNNQ